ncbi:hypothetical protein JCM33374_g4475 [Metschnikowia sp. JCM 33374]|nr:hypothetical protein JCM33374_g4475 [Metschnikowia sp. JCM 33374]
MAPQPIAPHPTSKPNYQSPSKLRAAELYAKANSRPISEFQSVPRKSSFTRDSETPEKPTTANSQRPSHRTTLRSPRPLSQISNSPGPQIPPNQSSKQQYNGGFKSKFMDSDDELDTRVGGTHRNGGFSSRFVDSDDESRGTRIPSSQHATDYSAMQSLRNKEEKEPKEKSKEKKPKKKFLKKLFGRN